MGRLRTFLAVELEPAARSRCLALQETFSRVAEGVKWVEAENLHVTLIFLGEVADRELPGVCRAVSAGCAGIDPFTMSVEGVSCFGDPRRPRTIWVGVGEGADELRELHDALEVELDKLGCHRREERAYTPHITLGRVKSDRPNDQLAEALADHADWRAGQGPVSRVLVMASDLTPRGPVYSVLSRARLGGAG